MTEARRGSIGRRRLALLLSLSGLLGCAAAMGLVLVFYGTPYNPLWWWVMGAILVVSFFLPRLLVPAVDWVRKGYDLDRAV